MARLHEVNWTAMKTITLMRHAKSSWLAASPGGAAPLDKARILALRGERDAPRMARWMAANGIRPQLIMCSTAQRTRETLALVANTILAEGGATTFRDELYLAEASNLMELLRRLPDRIGHAMLLGHDPGMHDLAQMLSGGGDIALRRLLSLKFPTAGAAVIDFATERWRDVAPGTGTLRHFMAPKRLPD